MKSHALILVSVALACAVPAEASLIIIPQFDPGSDFTVSEKNAINAAVGTYESLFTNNITVNIYFQAFTGGSGLGESDTFSYTDATYREFYNLLVATDANPTAIATLTAGGGNPNLTGGKDPVVGNSDIEIKAPDARALGFTAPALCYVTAGDTTPNTQVPNHCSSTPNSDLVDGIISLNLNITSPPNGLSGDYNLESVAEHEIDEVLGLGSNLDNTNSNTGTVTSTEIAPEDLWRYTSGGVRTFAVNCAAPGTAYFSITGTGSGTQFNNSCNGADFGDWAGTNGTLVQNAYGSPGTAPQLGAAEISALTAIGYVEATPEPGTWMLLLGSCTALAALKLRKEN